MADTMVKVARPIPSSGISQQHRDVTDERYRDLRKARKVRFFCNGDRYFKGKKIFVTPNRYLGFNDLLNDLTGKLPTTVQLPYGVRQIFTPVGGRKIRDIDELEDGKDYVCGGFETFKIIPYGNESLEPWTGGKPHGLHDLDKFASPGGYTPGGIPGQPGYQRNYYNAFQPGRSLRNYPRKGLPYGPTKQNYGAMWNQGVSTETSLKPKVVTVIRNGPKPRSNVKILLNRRSVQSYEQLVKDISEAFGPKWRNNRVRKLFSIRGREIQGVGDFFRDDEVFIGIGNESLTTGDVQEILEELYPDSPYAKNLMKEWEKTKKKQQHAYHAKLRPDDKLEERSTKIDSGLGSEGSGRDENESEATNKSTKETKKKKKAPKPQDDDTASQHTDATGQRMEKERVRYAEIERERARKRLAKRMEADRKILDEERRKKGLLPLKPIQDPFKKLQDDQKEKEQKEAREREDAKRAAAEHQRELSQAEVRARERARRSQAEADDSPRVIVVVKGKEPPIKDGVLPPISDSKSGRHKIKREDESGETRSQKSPVRQIKGADNKIKDTDNKIKDADNKIKEKERKDRENEERKEEKVDREKESKDAVKPSMAKEENPKNKDTTVAEENAENADAKSGGKDIDAKSVKDMDTKSVHDTVSEAASRTDSQPTEPSEPQKEKTPEPTAATEQPPPKSAPPKTPKSAPPKTPDKRNEQIEQKEKPHKNRQKSRIIRKTKLERQISSVDYVLNKYEPGKTLGDGNFAIVKTCKLKNSSHEFAMKVVDKSKLRGKEQMIENEIAIMKMCNHPSIVRLVEEFETKAEIYLIMELVKGGDLFDAITQSVKFDEKTASGMCIDVVNALFYLHSRDIVHRDLKPENLLVLRNKDGSLSLKLADFGLAMEVHQPIYTVCGTPTYVAPEILSEIGYGLEVDMWALGVITYILLCGFPPFRSPDRNQTELFEFIKAGEYDFLSPYWDNISRAAKDLISRLLIVDQRKRYTAVDVLVHPWVITYAGSRHPPAPMDEFRRSHRSTLDAQAKVNKAEFLALKGKAEKAT